MKLKSVLLIDDDHTTNVFHTVVLRRAQITDQILSMETPEIALDHLRKASRFSAGGFGQMTMPELIFLDVNMPRMTGYEFLTEFEKIYIAAKAKCVVFMLTSVIGSRDHDTFLDFKCVKGVLQKPLSREILTQIMNEHFKESLMEENDDNCLTRNADRPINIV
jgi:response regulator RpfG family c-di-GMP phosphodiesterase